MFCSKFRRISMDSTTSFLFLLFVLVIKVVLCQACVDDPTFSQAGNDCPSHVALASYNCYDTNVETSCCTSCAAVKRNVNGCEYGDRKPCFLFECASLIDISECCETCGTPATTTSTTTSTTSTASPFTTSSSTTSSTTSTSTPTSTTTTSTTSTSTATTPSTSTTVSTTPRTSTTITTTTPSTSTTATTTVSASMNATISPATSSTTPSTIRTSTTTPSTSSATTTPSTSSTTTATSLTTSTTSTVPVTSAAISTVPSTTTATTTTKRTILSTSVTSVSSVSPAVTVPTIRSSSSPQSSPTTVSAMPTVLSSGTTEQSSVTDLTTGNMSTTYMSTNNLTSAASNDTTSVFPDVTEASSRVLSGLELGFVIGFSSIGLVLLLAAAGLAAYCWGRKRGGGSTLKYSRSDYRPMDHTYVGRNYKDPHNGRHADLPILSLPQTNEVYVPYSGYSSIQNGDPGSLYYSSILPQTSLSSETPYNPYLYATYDGGVQRNGGSKRPYSVSDRYLYRPHRSSSNLSTRNSDVNNGGWHRSTSALYSDLSRSRVS